MNGDIKTAFIHKCLADYMQDVTKAMQSRIRRLQAQDTDTLLHSLAYKVYQQSAAGNANLSFAEWGRMVDMGVGKGHPLSGIDGTRYALSKRQKKTEGRQPKQVYSPIAYGKLNGLIGDLSHGYTDEAIAAIKTQLENGSRIN